MSRLRPTHWERLLGSSLHLMVVLAMPGVVAGALIYLYFSAHGRSRFVAAHAEQALCRGVACWLAGALLAVAAELALLGMLGLPPDRVPGWVAALAPYSAFAAALVPALRAAAGARHGGWPSPRRQGLPADR